MSMMHVIAVHGVGTGTGEERKGFSKDLKALVCENDPKLSDRWKECVWEDLNEKIDRRVGEIVGTLVSNQLRPFGSGGVKLLQRIVSWGLTLAVNLGIIVGAYATRQIVDLVSDFLLYLDSDHGQKIRNRLKGEILELASKHPEGIALVAHSLGSVIAYDVLAEAVCDKNPLPVKQLVTFGSPLAWTFDLRDVEEKDERRFTSIGGTKWTNFLALASF